MRDEVSKRLQTIKQFLADRPAFTEYQMREWLKLEDKYHFYRDKIATKPFKQILIDPVRFDEFLMRPCHRAK